MRTSCLSLLSALLFLSNVAADELRDANRLLRASNVESQFETIAQQQTRNIIRRYNSIVVMSANVELPQWIKLQIDTCYREAFAWEKFEVGIAQILMENFNSNEIHLLINFHQSRGLPPMEIPNFKAALAKGEVIQKLVVDFISANSEGCVAHDAELILAYLADRRRQQLDANLAAE